MNVCDTCSTEYEGDVCPNCAHEDTDLSDEMAWVRGHEVIAPDPKSHEAHELAIAIYTLQNSAQYDAAAIEWARAVVGRYVPGSTP